MGLGIPRVHGLQLDDVYSLHHHLISLTTKLGLFLPNLALVALPSVAFTTPLVPRAQQVVREAQQPVSAGICVKICSAHLQPTFCLSTMILPGLRAHVGQRLLAKDSAEQSSARRKRLRKPRRWYRRFTVDIKHKSVYCMCIIRAITARHCRPLAGPSLHTFSTGPYDCASAPCSAQQKCRHIAVRGHPAASGYVEVCCRALS